MINLWWVLFLAAQSPHPAARDAQPGAPAAFTLYGDSEARGPSMRWMFPPVPTYEVECPESVPHAAKERCLILRTADYHASTITVPGGWLFTQ